MENNMFDKVHERFESLTAREKIIVFTMVLVVIWSSWDSFIYRPLAARQKQLDLQLTNLTSQISHLEQSSSELEKTAQSDPNAENLNKLNALKAQYGRLQDQILFGNKKFVPPDLMAKALGDMLTQNEQLTLIKLETLPPDTLLSSKDQHQPIYKHGLSITFTGTYAETVDYLEALESLPWAIVWDVLDYKVKNYPKAEVTVRVLTLSFDKEWMGV
jgi:MSHA biogenesis protein MshJ